jgi:hypothetical protein
VEDGWKKKRWKRRKTNGLENGARQRVPPNEGGENDGSFHPLDFVCVEGNILKRILLSLSAADAGVLDGFHHPGLRRMIRAGGDSSSLVWFRFGGEGRGGNAIDGRAECLSSRFIGSISKYIIYEGRNWRRRRRFFFGKQSRAENHTWREGIFARPNKLTCPPIPLQ